MTIRSWHYCFCGSLLYLHSPFSFFSVHDYSGNSPGCYYLSASVTNARRSWNRKWNSLTRRWAPRGVYPVSHTLEFRGFDATPDDPRLQKNLAAALGFLALTVASGGNGLDVRLFAGKFFLQIRSVIFFSNEESWQGYPSRLCEIFLSIFDEGSFGWLV